MITYNSSIRFDAIAITALVLSGLAAPAIVIAQEASDREIEEIVVTAPEYVSTGSRSATKSDLPLVETPQSVTVISRDMIDLLNWTSLNESVRYTAGTTGESFGPDERYDWLMVRGFNPVQFIDGVQAPIGSVNNTGTDLYGSESVEVLKGPASVLYGQTPPGGIVNMTSRRPRDEFEGELEAQLGEYSHMQINGDVTGALTDGVSGRLTALYRDRETQVDFLQSERIYIAPALKIQVAPNTQLTFLGNYQDDDIANQSTGFLPAFGTVLPNPLGTVPVGRNLGETGYNEFKREQFSIGYDFSHDFSESLTIQQNLKHFDVDVDSRAVFGTGLLDADFDGVPDDFRTVTRSDFPFNEDIKSTTVDTRVYWEVETGAVSHTLLFGLDHRMYDGFSEFGFAAAPPLDLFNPVYNSVIPPATLFPFIDETRDQTGLYVQDQIKVNNVVLTVSGRHDWLDTDTAFSSLENEETTYRFGVNYVFESGFAPYIQTAKSFEPVSGADFNGNPFVPSTGQQIEAGVKFDGEAFAPDLNLFASLAIYEIVQENVLTPDPDPSRPFFSVQTGEVEVQGVELEAAARLNEQLTFNFSYTYLDSEVTKSNGPDLGKDLVAVPDTLASVLVDYTFQSGPLAGFGAGLGVRHRGELFGDPANDWKTGSVTVLDAILHYDTRKWRIALNANNFTDKIFVDRCSSVANCFYGARRLVTGSVTRKF